MRENKFVYFELFDKDSNEIASGRLWSLDMARKLINGSENYLILRTDIRNLLQYRKEIKD